LKLSGANYYSNIPFFDIRILCFQDTATTEIYTLSLHDALPISRLSRMVPGTSKRCPGCGGVAGTFLIASQVPAMPIGMLTRKIRSEEHTSELQSREKLVCRLLLEKKKNKKRNDRYTLHN